MSSCLLQNENVIRFQNYIIGGKVGEFVLIGPFVGCQNGVGRIENFNLSVYFDSVRHSVC